MMCDCKHENFTANCESVQKLVCRFCRKTEREIVLEMKLEMANKCCDEAEEQLAAANARVAEAEVCGSCVNFETCYLNKNEWHWQRFEKCIEWRGKELE